MSKKEQDVVMLQRLGNWIKLIRCDAKLSRQELAAATDMTTVAIAYIENGKRWPRPSSLARIAKALDVSVHDLFHTFSKI